VAVPETYFAISYSPALKPIFWLVRMGPTRSGVWVAPESMRVSMGQGFRATIPLASVNEISRDSGAVRGWGVHGLRGQWLVNGSSSGLVRLEIGQGAKASVMGRSVPLRTLRLSLTHPDGLIAALTSGRQRGTA
jgi:hypothetical protein